MAKSIASLLGQAMARVSVAEAPDYAPMKPAVYDFTIQKAQFKANKSGTGYLLNLGAKTTKNRWLWHSFNLIHPNPTAQQISSEQFAALLEQLGLEPSQFTQPEHFPTHLEGQSFSAYVSIKGGDNVFSNFKQTTPIMSKPQDDWVSDDIPF